MDLDIDASTLPIRRFAAGDRIVWPGDDNPAIYLLGGGTIEIVLDGVPFRKIRECLTFIGELSALTGSKRSAEVRAVEDCTCYLIEDIAQLHEDNPGVYALLANDIAHKTKVNILRMASMRRRLLESEELRGTGIESDPAYETFVRRWTENARHVVDNWPSTLGVADERDEIRTYAAGEYLFHEGARPGKVFVLLDGKITHEQREPGEPLPVQDSPNAAVNLTECVAMPTITSARAAVDSRVRIIGDIPRRFSEDREFGVAVTRLFARRLQLLTQAMTKGRALLDELAAQDPDGPVAKLAALAKLAECEMFDELVTLDRTLN